MLAQRVPAVSAYGARARASSKSALWRAKRVLEATGSPAIPERPRAPAQSHRLPMLHRARDWSSVVSRRPVPISTHRRCLHVSARHWIGVVLVARRWRTMAKRRRADCAYSGRLPARMNHAGNGPVIAHVAIVRPSTASGAGTRSPTYSYSPDDPRCGSTCRGPACPTCAPAIAPHPTSSASPQSHFALGRSSAA